MELQWEVKDDNSVDFKIMLPYIQSWVAIGFGDSMKDTDMVVAQIFEGNVVKLYEGISKGVKINIYFI